MRFRKIGVLSLTMLMLRFIDANAQLSPGELHASHAFLEGVENCTKCHGTDRKTIAPNCLSCHTPIQEELKSGTGLHGTQKSGDCQLCHIEHHGRDFTLIHWEKGEKEFDHSLTGYQLDGKHAALDCRKCHRQEFIQDAAALLAQKVDLNKTYLGLNTNCQSCHFDEHRGQLGNNCAKCHTTADWKPASGFDHAQTDFPLLGKHAEVLCVKCHVVQTDDAKRDDGHFAKFTQIAHGQCTDCHTDVHKGKLGANCTNCHSVNGWQVGNKADFDHKRTRYPLVGKHAKVACDKCHVPGRERGTLKFGACTECHADFHKGEFAARSTKGACDECHTVNGFSPSLFTMAMHDSTDYPLTGAHQAIPCVMCHVQTSKRGSDRSYHFAFASTRCLVCHQDPHRGEVKKFVDQDGCEFCHSVESWQMVQFDHKLTKFALEGGHADVSCRKCHTGEIKGKETLTFVNSLQDCRSCHIDPHLGQFASEDQGNTDCSRCHTPKSWKELSFVHDRDSRFKLEGAHQKVPCAKCHFKTTESDPKIVLYKPLETTCVSCHGTDNVVEKEKKS